MSNYGPPPSGYGPAPGYGAPPVQHVVHSYAVQPQGWRCPYCGFAGQPVQYTSITTAGWIVFVLLLFLCIILCWIPLISMREQKTVCPGCRTKIS